MPPLNFSADTFVFGAKRQAGAFLNILQRSIVRSDAFKILRIAANFPF